MIFYHLLIFSRSQCEERFPIFCAGEESEEANKFELVQEKCLSPSPPSPSVVLENGHLPIFQAPKIQEEQNEEVENSDTEEHAETPQSFDLQVSYFKWKILKIQEHK